MIGAPAAAGVLAALWLALLSAGAGAGARAVQEPPQVTGADFLARSQAQRAHYVAGLADQLVFLHRASLTDGFAWFEACLAARGRRALADALARSIEARPSRLAEPAARNFLWAAARLCTGP
jgi:hypothetical protein